jgi:hypothetical protein
MNDEERHSLIISRPGSLKYIKVIGGHSNNPVVGVQKPIIHLRAVKKE